MSIYLCVHFDVSEQWTRGTERNDILSCQLAELSSVPSTVVDELNECILLDGAQEAEIRNATISHHEDIRQYSNPCFRTTAVRRVADVSKINTQGKLLKHMNAFNPFRPEFIQGKKKDKK